MKIVHVILAAVYKEGFGYQENILSAKHVELGLDTHIITLNYDYPDGYFYVNRDNINIHILPLNKQKEKMNHFRKMFSATTIGLEEKLCSLNPDIIFVHGLQSIDILQICHYCKHHKNVKLYVDQHADYYNSPLRPFKRGLYIKLVFGYIARQLEKYAQKFWGVTPWRVDYLQNVYGIKPENTDLLVMGGDDKYINWDSRSIIRKSIREQYNIPEEAFLVISGGKIDKTKNIHLLIDAVKAINKKDLYLFVFGNYTDDMESYCRPKFGNNIINIGWLKSNDVYPYFLASDLVIFPGTHSVLWEQALACGLPAVFKDWDGGFNHVDCGGNCILLKDISTTSLSNVIENIYSDKVLFNSMKEVAEGKARQTFSYLEIAKKAIEL